MRPRLLILIPLLLALAACKVELNRGLTEREANEVVAALLRQGIPAERLTDPAARDTGGRNVIVQVPQSRFAESVEVLRAQGLPRQSFVSMGEVFRGDGLVNSPTEERARLIWAMGQELSRTVAEIDGVLAARVHLVLPENDALRREATPSSAAVFIRHVPDAPIATLVPQIKLMVASAVAGLSYDRVTVTLVPAAVAAPATAPPPMEQVLGLWVSADSADPLRMALAAGAALLVLLLGLLGWSRARPRTTSGLPVRTGR
jgi:type III secretion protein J